MCQKYKCTNMSWTVIPVSGCELEENEFCFLI